MKWNQQIVVIGKMKAKQLIKTLKEFPEKEVTLSISDKNKQIFCEEIFEVTIQDKITIVANISEEYPQVSEGKK